MEIDEDELRWGRFYTIESLNVLLNTSEVEQNGRHCADVIFKLFCWETFGILCRN